MLLGQYDKIPTKDKRKKQQEREKEVKIYLQELERST